MGKLSDYPCPPPQWNTQAVLWQDQSLPPPPMPGFRLAQGPFDITQDDGWRLAGSTSPNSLYYSNPGMGFVAYAAEEGGPSIAAREGKQSLDAHIDALLALPFADVLYIRCDWRDVQSQPGRLNLSPIWGAAISACEKRGKRLAFRIQMSNTVGQTERLAMPDFLLDKVPVTKLYSAGGMYNPGGFIEPRYDHPAFLDAAVEVSELLAKRFDNEPYMEFVDLMMYGFWGEGHTNDYPNPIPFPVGERVFLHLTEAQRLIWKNTPLCVNIQTDISGAGNYAVHNWALRNHFYIRTDSIMVDEPMSNELASHRPPHVALVMEDGAYRTHDMGADWFTFDDDGVNVIENVMFHALDLGGNYYCLWTEGENLQKYYEAYPRGFDALKSSLGYRVRPSWIYQRKRYGGTELILMLHNDGVASVPGHLLLELADPRGNILVSGCLDAGQPYAGRTRQCAFPLTEDFTGEYVFLRAYLLDKKGKRPVRFACKNSATVIMGREAVESAKVRPDENAPAHPDEFSFRIRLGAPDAFDWRKNI